MTTTEVPQLTSPVGGSLVGKVAIVTGAARSIGRSIAESLAEAGASVVVHFRSRREQADATVEALVESGAAAIAVPGDLSRSDEVTALFDRAEQKFGGVDIVVANAGIPHGVEPVAEISDATYDRMLATNTTGTFYVLREASRRVRDGGRIINITSSSVRLVSAGFGAYSSSKAAAITTIGVLAKELGTRGITANSLMAGPIAAGFLDTSSGPAAFAPPGMLEALAASAPAGRMGLPTDIGPIAAFLASPRAGWINGQVLLANNGGAV